MDFGKVFFQPVLKMAAEYFTHLGVTCEHIFCSIPIIDNISTTGLNPGGWKSATGTLHSVSNIVSKKTEELCYGTASCLLSYLINHASPISSNELSNTSVGMLWNSSLFNLLHFIIVWSCGHYYKVWQLLGITPHCWLNAMPLLHTAYTQTLSLFSQTIFLHSYFLICSFFHTLSSYLLIFLSLTHPIAGSYLIGEYLDYILLDDKPGLV